MLDLWLAKREPFSLEVICELGKNWPYLAKQEASFAWFVEVCPYLPPSVSLFPSLPFFLLPSFFPPPSLSFFLFTVFLFNWWKLKSMGFVSWCGLQHDLAPSPSVVSWERTLECWVEKKLPMSGNSINSHDKTNVLISNKWRSTPSRKPIFLALHLLLHLFSPQHWILIFILKLCLNYMIKLYTCRH